MENPNLSIIFTTFKNELLSLSIETHISVSRFDSWKTAILPYLEGNYKIKINRMTFAEDHYMEIAINHKNVNSAQVLLDDLIFKYSTEKMTEERMKILKLLKARENSLDFDEELSLMIIGDNQKFPYKSSSYMTKFFQSLGFDFTHTGETRRIWTEDCLNKLNTQEVYFLISRGLFKKKYFINFCKSNSLDLDSFYQDAIQEFKTFIENSLSSEDPFDLTQVLGLNVNIELLFENKADTSDQPLNDLIKEAKDRFSKNDRQVAIEKIWDAFERIKTFYQEKDKKTSAEKLVKFATEGFDFDFLNEEFKKLTEIGNGYRIRHHEVGKKDLSSEHTNYLFFRMISLIDLCLVSIRDHTTEELDPLDF